MSINSINSSEVWQENVHMDFGKIIKPEENESWESLYRRLQEDIFGREQTHPLHRAAELGCSKAIKKLVGEGRDIHGMDGEGRTPLFVSVIKNQQKLVKTLLKLGADKNKGIIDETDGEVLCRPLNKAVVLNQQDLIGLLIDSNSDYSREVWVCLDKHYPKNECREIFKKLREGGVNIQQYPLIVKEVSLLKEKNYTKEELEGTLEKIQFLAEEGFEIDALDSNGNTALQLACGLQLVPVIDLLIKHKANIWLKDKNGDSAVTWALFGSNPEIESEALQKEFKEWAIINALSLVQKMPFILDPIFKVINIINRIKNMF